MVTGTGTGTGTVTENDQEIIAGRMACP